VAEKVFGTPFCEWGHEDGDSVIRACNTVYSVPSAAREHIDFVSGLVHFPSHKGRARKLSSPSADSGDVATLRTSYSIGEVKATSGNSSAAFTQFIGQWYGHNMLPKFLNKYTPDMADQPAPKAVGPDRSGAGTEANLDAQYITAMGHGADIWVWTNQNKNSVNNQEPWVQFFSNVSAAADLPLIFSISYGEGEDTLTKDYMDRSDVELQKIATRGISMMAASGDNGAGCSDGKFVANFPADLPHITSVGGTSSCRSGSGAAGFSSGGFSNTYPQQSWQAAAVKTYLSGSNVPASSYFNATGRAYPDVAACGSVVICSDFICGLGVEGTSCASPIFAGTMALVNDKRLAAGKSPLGFLNPMLYANAAAFDDVTSGSTQGCVGAHWTAVAGWDPTTGLGTPNYSKLVAAALAQDAMSDVNSYDPKVNEIAGNGAAFLEEQAETKPFLGMDPLMGGLGGIGATPPMMPGGMMGGMGYPGVGMPGFGIGGYGGMPGMGLGTGYTGSVMGMDPLMGGLGGLGSTAPGAGFGMGAGMNMGMPGMGMGMGLGYPGIGMGASPFLGGLGAGLGLGMIAGA